MDAQIGRLNAIAAASFAAGFALVVWQDLRRPTTENHYSIAVVLPPRPPVARPGAFGMPPTRGDDEDEDNPDDVGAEQPDPVYGI